MENARRQLKVDGLGCTVKRADRQVAFGPRQQVRLRRRWVPCLGYPDQLVGVDAAVTFGRIGR